jgi:transcriptional regulator with XRE-family HTH domain
MATLTVGSLGEYIREQRESTQVSLRQLAKTAGVSNPYLSQIERGVKKPSAEILSQIAKGLRISAETLYIRAGILDDHQGSDVVAAILADVAIGERHKQTLIDVYESFRAEHGATPAPATKATAKKATAKKTGATKTTARKTAASKPTAKKTTAKKRST